MAYAKRGGRISNVSIANIAAMALIVAIAGYGGSIIYNNLAEGFKPAPAQAPIAFLQMSAVPGSMSGNLLKDINHVTLKNYKQAVIQTAAKCVELNVSEKSAHSDEIKTGCARAWYDMDHLDK